MSDSQAFLDESGGESFPAIKFANVGDTVVGTLIKEPTTVIRESLKDGSPEKQLPINLECASVPAGDPGPRTLWVRRGFLASAIAEAVKDAGGEGLQAGGKLSVKFTEERDTGKPFPAKVFKAKYEMPVSSGVAVDDIF